MTELRRAHYPAGLGAVAVRREDGEAVITVTSGSTNAARRRAVCEMTQFAARQHWTAPRDGAHPARHATAARRKVPAWALLAVSLVTGTGVLAVTVPARPAGSAPGPPAVTVTHHARRRRPDPVPVYPVRDQSPQVASTLTGLRRWLCAALPLATVAIAAGEVLANQIPLGLTGKARVFP